MHNQIDIQKHLEESLDSKYVIIEEININSIQMLSNSFFSISNNQNQYENSISGIEDFLNSYDESKYLNIVFLNIDFEKKYETIFKLLTVLLPIKKNIKNNYNLNIIFI